MNPQAIFLAEPLCLVLGCLGRSFSFLSNLTNYTPKGLLLHPIFEEIHFVLSSC